MVKCLKDNGFEIAQAEHLLAAFRVLDPENKGYIQKEVMHELLTTKGIPFREREIESFLTFAVDKSGQLVYYEDYVTRLMEVTERHREYLVKDFETFNPRKP